MARFYQKRRFRSRGAFRRTMRPYYARKIRRFRRLRKMFARPRVVKPELKYTDQDINLAITPTAGFSNASLTDSSIPQGVTTGTRIGNQVKLTKVRAIIKLWLSPTQATAIVSPIQFFRMIIWTPRIAQADVSTYFATMPFMQTVPHQIATVWKDIYFKLGYQQTMENISTHPPTPDKVLWKMRFKFPRRVNFQSNTATAIDPNNAVMFITFFNNDPDYASFTLNVRFHSRVFYTDV